MTSINSINSQANITFSSLNQELSNSKDEFKKLTKSTSINELSKLGVENLQKLTDSYTGKRNVLSRIGTSIAGMFDSSTTHKSTVIDKLNQAVELAKTKEKLDKINENLDKANEKLDGFMNLLKNTSGGIGQKLPKANLSELRNQRLEPNFPDTNTNGKLKDDFLMGSYDILKEGNSIEKLTLASAYANQFVSETLCFMDDMAQLANNLECDHYELLEPEKSKLVLQLVGDIKNKYISKDGDITLNLSDSNRKNMHNLLGDLEKELLNKSSDKKRNTSALTRSVRNIQENIPKLVEKVAHAASLNEVKGRILNDVSKVQDQGRTEGTRPVVIENNDDDIQPNKLYDPKTFVEFNQEEYALERARKSEAIATLEFETRFELFNLIGGGLIGTDGINTPEFKNKVIQEFIDRLVSPDTENLDRDLDSIFAKYATPSDKVMPIFDESSDNDNLDLDESSDDDSLDLSDITPGGPVKISFEEELKARQIEEDLLMNGIIEDMEKE